MHATPALSLLPVRAILAVAAMVFSGGPAIAAPEAGSREADAVRASTRGGDTSTKAAEDLIIESIRADWARSSSALLSSQVDGRRPAANPPYGQRYAGYIENFRQLRVISVSDGRVTVELSGRILTFSNGEKAGPGQQLHVEIDASRMHLAVNATGERVVSVPLQDERVRETTAKANPRAPWHSSSDMIATKAVVDAPVPESDRHCMSRMVAVPAAVLAAFDGPMAVDSTVPPRPARSQLAETTRQQDLAFLEFRPPQLTIFDTQLGHIIGLLVRGLPLKVEVSPEDAAIPLDQFEVSGALPAVIRALGNKTRTSIAIQGDSVVVARRKAMLVPLGEALGIKKTGNIQFPEEDVNFETGQSATRRLEIEVRDVRL